MAEALEDLAASDPLVGRTIAGKLRLERWLGAGAMGAVYEARQTALDRSVALKVMHRELASDTSFAERFHREAKAASRLDHPNVVRVLDYGQEPDGLLYYAMEYLDGRDLFRVIEEDWPLSHERIVDIVSQALAGLAAAHDAGVLHRDLKPENIMVLRRKADDGSPIDLVKVCDFGIAKIVEAEAVQEVARADGSRPSARKLSTTGLVVGTPEYMSPEQARGETLDARSDLYSVGVVLYQMLTGRLPFQGRTPLSTVLKVLHDPPPAPSTEAAPSVAPALEPICVRALGKTPEERYPDARAMRAAMREAAPRSRRMSIGAEHERPAMAHAPTVAHVGELPSGSHDPTTAAAPVTSHGAERGWRYAGIAAAIVAMAAGGVIAGRRAKSGAAPVVVSSAEAIAAPSAPAASAPTEGAAMVAEAPSVASAALVTSADVAATPTPPATRATPRTRARDPRPAPVAAGDVARPAASSPSLPPASPPEPIASSAPAASATAPALSPVPAPPPTPAASVPQPPATIRPEAARVIVGAARSNNAAASAMGINRALSPLHARIGACYQRALAGGAQPPSGGQTAGTLHIETDDQGYVTDARVNAAVPGEAARCIETIARTVHLQVDTGGASADIPLTFWTQ